MRENLSIKSLGKIWFINYISSLEKKMSICKKNFFEEFRINLLKSDKEFQTKADRNEGVNAFKIQLLSNMGDYLFK